MDPLWEIIDSAASAAIVTIVAFGFVAVTFATLAGIGSVFNRVDGGDQ